MFKSTNIERSTYMSKLTLNKIGRVFILLPFSTKCVALALPSFFLNSAEFASSKCSTSHHHNAYYCLLLQNHAHLWARDSSSLATDRNKQAIDRKMQNRMYNSGALVHSTTSHSLLYYVHTEHQTTSGRQCHMPRLWHACRKMSVTEQTNLNWKFSHTVQLVQISSLAWDKQI